MILLFFLVSYFGIRIVGRTNSEAFDSIGIFPKKLSVWAIILSILISTFCFWFKMNPFLYWWTVCGVVIASPAGALLIKWRREKQVPQLCLIFLDEVILSMKAGQSLRLAIRNRSGTGRPWFDGFLGGLESSLGLDSNIETDSLWFNRWQKEIRDIEKSKSKTIEQLEVIRRYVRLEIQLEKKLKRVSEGPKMQASFMFGLFLVLNYLGWGSLPKDQTIWMISGAWVLFLLGLALTFGIMRSFKWKV